MPTWLLVLIIVILTMLITWLLIQSRSRRQDSGFFIFDIGADIFEGIGSIIGVVFEAVFGGGSSGGGGASD